RRCSAPVTSATASARTRWSSTRRGGGATGSAPVSDLLHTDAVVGEALGPHASGIPDVAAVEQHLLLEPRLDLVEIQVAELAPLRDQHQRVRTVARRQRVIGVAHAVAEDALGFL